MYCFDQISRKKVYLVNIGKKSEQLLNFAYLNFLVTKLQLKLTITAFFCFFFVKNLPKKGISSLDKKNEHHH